MHRVCYASRRSFISTSSKWTGPLDYFLSCCAVCRSTCGAKIPQCTETLPQTRSRQPPLPTTPSQQNCARMRLAARPMRRRWRVWSPQARQMLAIDTHIVPMRPPLRRRRRPTSAPATWTTSLTHDSSSALGPTLNTTLAWTTHHRVWLPRLPGERGSGTGATRRWNHPNTTRTGTQSYSRT